MHSQQQSLHEFYDLNHFEHHFNKSFTLSNNELKSNLEEYEFSNFFDRQEWTIDDLQLIAENLFCVKSKLNDYNLNQWGIQTSKFALFNIHSCYASFGKFDQTEEDRQIKPELFTRAWIKLYEILVKFKLKESIAQNDSIGAQRRINCLFLCEAPGAFVAASNHFVKQEFSDQLKFSWMASSLNPYFEGNDQFHDTLTEDCFIEQTFDNWYFGPHNSGNIQQPNFHGTLKEEFKKRLADGSNGRFNLITADGGMRSIEEPGEQETNSFKLILNEALVALNCLDDGGSFVLKIFGFFNCRTISLIYFLTCLFESVHLFKPISSKEGNSEIYMVCINYQLNKNARLVELVTGRFEESKKSANGESNALLFRREVIPTDFLNQLIECANMFATHQTNAIERTVYFNEADDRKFYYGYKKLQAKINQHFNQLVNLKPIKKSDQLVKISLKLDFRKSYYFDGINRKLLMAYDEPNSYAELIRDRHRPDKKLASIKQLIGSVYLVSKRELFSSFNKFHRFNQHSASKALQLQNFVIQPKSHLNQKSPKYSNTKLCCDRLVKVLIDYESLEGSSKGVRTDRKMQSYEQTILNQFTELFKSRLDNESTFDLQSHMEQAGDLSSILSKVCKSFGTPSEHRKSLLVHVIDLLNLPSEILDDEHCTANQLVAKLVEIVNRLRFDDMLVIALPSLFTRYAFGLIYLCTCMFKQFTISPVYLRESRSGLIFVFTNELETEPTTLQADESDHLAAFNEQTFEQERSQVSSSLKQIDHFNQTRKEEQILDFVGMHNVMSDRQNTDFLKFVILANNLNLIESLKLRIDL